MASPPLLTPTFVDLGGWTLVAGFTKDSPQMHMAFERSEWVYASNLTIQAPGDSPNTDGIHLQHAKNIFIDYSRIMTGEFMLLVN